MPQARTEDFEFVLDATPDERRQLGEGLLTI
jgi:hypothetical protein